MSDSFMEEGGESIHDDANAHDGNQIVSGHGRPAFLRTFPLGHGMPPSHDVESVTGRCYKPLTPNGLLSDQ
jgi:hypothetical protein